MLTVQRVAALCEEVGGNLQPGDGLRFRTIDAATALLLALGALDRLLAAHPAPGDVVEKVGHHLEKARSRLHAIQSGAQTAAEDELKRNVVEARRLLLTATSMLLEVTA
jgi:hypothetical protein